mmetsp:Transcript_16901/g.41547  ORF Transcript_16901/g.41547 Transcript_16901/m.41547 type:complete len:87 (-) Transcript_16901:159-419(-)
MGAPKKAGLRLPKRKFIERLTQRPMECMPQMMAVLECLKAHSFDDGRCGERMQALQMCVQSTTKAAGSKSNSVFYHLIRLHHLQKR